MRPTRFCCAAALWLALGGPLAAQRVSVDARLDDLRAAAQRDSNDAAAHYNLAMGYWSKKRYAEAERSLRTAIQIEPQFAAAYLALGVVHNWDDEYWRRLGRSDSAVSAYFREANSLYRKAFMLDPLVDIRILGGTYRFYSGDRVVRAFRDLVEGRYDKAYESLDKEVQSRGGRAGPDSAPPLVLWLRGLSAARTEHYDVAIHDMDNLLGRVQLAQVSDSAKEVPLVANEFRYLLAALHQKSGYLDKAIELYRQVVEYDVGHFMAHVQLARIYEAQRDYGHAAQERQYAINANPDDPSLLLDLGITLGKAGLMSQAETQLQAAASANRRDSRALYWLAMAQLAQGKREAARASFSRFVELAPSRYEPQITAAKERLAELR